MGRNVFVSFAFRDRPRIEGVLEQLRRRRVISQDDNVFVDYSGIAAADNYRETTKEVIAAADKVLVIWTRAAAQSAWVNYELGMADALKKPIVLAVLKDDVGDTPGPPIEAQRLELQGA